MKLQKGDVYFRALKYALPTVFIFLLLYLARQYNYLLFHGFAEIFSIVVAANIFFLAWNSRRFLENDYLLFIGISYIFVAGLDLIHTFAFPGMGIFTGFGTNLTVELWIAVRYVHAISFLMAPLFFHRKLRVNLAIGGYIVVATLLMVSIFVWDIFPDCYVEGVGITSFKKISEYVISLIFIGSIALLTRNARHFEKRVLTLLVASTITMVASELAFTLYIGVTDLPNMIGHYLKIVSFYLVYQALIVTGLEKPFDLLFVNLKRSETALRHAHNGLEVKVEERTLELKQSIGELERSNEELENFAHVASHDLQEPLRMVSSYLQLLEKRYRGKLDAEADEFITFAVDGAKRMQELIQGLLSFSRVGTRGKEFSLIDCNETIEKVLSSHKLLIEKNGVVISYDPLPTIMADDGQITQVFQNLIENAIKFRSQADPQVHLRAESRDGEWLFSVKDNGIGIDPQYHRRIFELFERLYPQEYPGTGIGLSICKKIVERHGGQIWVESQLGNGSTFYFTIPDALGGISED